MKLLCTGDLHLGAGGDLGRAPGDRLHDQADVWTAIVATAIERDVDGILFAGDAFEGPGIPPEQLQAFALGVALAHAAGIPILAITGNGKHDAAVRQTNGLAIFEHIPGITVASTPDVHLLAGCAIATLPWVHPGRYIAAHGRDVGQDETNSVVAELLLEAARGLRAQIPEEATAILLAHWSVSGSSLPNGLPVADLREPVLDGAELADLGFDAVILGHIHAPQYLLGDGTACTVIRGDGETPTAPARKPFYVGSPMPLNFGETGTAHGVWILDLGASSTTFVPIESRRLVTLDLSPDADLEWTLGEAVEVAGGSDVLDDAIVRVRYTATSEQAQRIDVGQLRETIAQVASVVKIQPTIVRADRARIEGLDDQVDELDALNRWIDANGVGVGLAASMRERFSSYLEAIAA